LSSEVVGSSPTLTVDDVYISGTPIRGPVMIVIDKITVVTKSNHVLYETAHESGMWIPRVNDTIALRDRDLWRVRYVVWGLVSKSLDVVVEPELDLLE
jgi:hypothetical protein